MGGGTRGKHVMGKGRMEMKQKRGEQSRRNVCGGGERAENLGF